MLRLRLRSGRTLSVTRNHPLRVISERGFIIWRNAGRIKPERHNCVGSCSGETKRRAGDGLSEDEAIFLGYLVAEGITLGHDNEVRFTNYGPRSQRKSTRKIVRGLVRTLPVKNYHDTQHVVHSDHPSEASRKRLRSRLRDCSGQERFPPASVPPGTRRSVPSSRHSSKAMGGLIPHLRLGWVPLLRNWPGKSSSCSTGSEFRRPSRQNTARSTTATTGL